VLANMAQLSPQLQPSFFVSFIFTNWYWDSCKTAHKSGIELVSRIISTHFQDCSVVLVSVKSPRKTTELSDFIALQESQRELRAFFLFGIDQKEMKKGGNETLKYSPHCKSVVCYLHYKPQWREKLNLSRFLYLESDMKIILFSSLIQGNKPNSYCYLQFIWNQVQNHHTTKFPNIFSLHILTYSATSQ